MVCSAARMPDMEVPICLGFFRRVWERRFIMRVAGGGADVLLVCVSEIGCAPPTLYLEDSLFDFAALRVHLKNSATMTTALAAGRATVSEVREIQDILYAWGLSKGGNEKVAQEVVNCLDETFLLSLPTPERNHSWPEHPGPANWRYLFHRQIARLLGWREKKREGHPDGVPPEVERFLREKHWPKVSDEAIGEDNGSKSTITGANTREGEAAASSNSVGGGSQRSNKRRIAPMRAAPIARRTRRTGHRSNNAASGGESPPVTP